MSEGMRHLLVPAHVCSKVATSAFMLRHSLLLFPRVDFHLVYGTQTVLCVETRGCVVHEK